MLHVIPITVQLTRVWNGFIMVAIVYVHKPEQAAADVIGVTSLVLSGTNNCHVTRLSPYIDVCNKTKQEI